MNNKVTKKYFKVGIVSVVLVIALSLILLYSLYSHKILEWEEIVMLGSSLAGGMIGCIGTLIAVLLTIYETDMMQSESKKSEYRRSAYDNMPVFTIGHLEDVQPINVFSELREDVPYDINKERELYIQYAKENMKSYIKVDFIIKNISDKFVNLKRYRIKAYYNEKSILEIYPNENVKDYLINPNLREKTKIEAGYDTYNYNQPIISEKETKQIKARLSSKEYIENKYKDIYIHVFLEYENMLKQNFEQELIMICNKNKEIFYCGENIPTLIMPTEK